LSATIAVQIVGVFAIMFVGIVIVVLLFVHSSSKAESSRELQKKKIEVLDRHFNEMVRIECPYCKTLYSSDRSDCPNCGADKRKIKFPKISELD
jgi:hypothetical protein